MNTIISASILSADLCNLERDIKRAEDAGCEYIHFDVMDGVFVNNISYGIPVFKAVSRVTKAVLDVHLMIIDPLKYVKNFADAGADIITFHYESDSDCGKCIDAIHACGRKAGVAIKPGTPATVLEPYLDKAVMFLIMTVEPGFGGQEFIYDMTGKISELKKMLDERKLSTPIQVDGGINDTTAVLTAEHGAEIIVTGSYLFKAPDMRKAADNIRNNILDKKL